MCICESDRTIYFAPSSRTPFRRHARAGRSPDRRARATTPRVHARMRDRNYYLTRAFDDELKIMICGHRPRDPWQLITWHDTLNICGDLFSK